MKDSLAIKRGLVVADRWRMFSLLIVALFLLKVISGCCPPCCPQPEKKPVVILTNSLGQKTSEFTIMEAVFGSFSGLQPATRYDIQILRSDGKEISSASLTTDKRGIIPTIALWWDVGVEYTETRVGRLNPEMIFKYKYSCLVKRDEKIIVEIPIRIRRIDETGPIIYSSDKSGNPLNGFMHRKESVYLTGKNFPAGSKLYIYAVRDRYSWEVGDRFDPVLGRPHVLQLAKSQRDFTTLILHRDHTEISSYDFIVEYEIVDGIFTLEDLMDSHYGVGFTIFLPLPLPGPPAPSHIETDLACQAPPYDPITGTVIGAPNPVYKDVFAVVEEVWVAVNPHAGGGDYVGNTARLYVVTHKIESNWLDGIALTDVSTDGFETVVIQPGCANVNYTRVWSSPAIGEYDVVVDFSPFGQYDKGKDIIDKLDDIGFTVPTLWVCLDSVEFNHNTTSNTSDALNIRKNKTSIVIVPEWKKARKSYPAAYIKNKTITVTAYFSAASGVFNAKIRAGVGYGSLSSINQKTVSFPGGTSGVVSFQVASPTPNEVKKFYQKWNWYCEDINGTGSSEVLLGASKNKIFIVLTEPQSPWTTTGQTQPWVDALVKSCLWAYGETTPAGAAEEITHHLYLDVGGLYVYGSQYTGSTTADFDLTNFLNNIPSISLVNCYDMGKSLVIFANVVGCNSSYKYKQPFGPLYCEKAIGRAWKCNENFGNHGFGNIVDNVFDACLTMDTDADPEAPPHLETWMTNIPWSNYKTKVVKVSLSGTPVMYLFGIY